MIVLIWLIMFALMGISPVNTISTPIQKRISHRKSNPEEQITISKGTRISLPTSRLPSFYHDSYAFTGDISAPKDPTGNGDLTTAMEHNWSPSSRLLLQGRQLCNGDCESVTVSLCCGEDESCNGLPTCYQPTSTTSSTTSTTTTISPNPPPTSPAQTTNLPSPTELPPTATEPPTTPNPSIVTVPPPTLTSGPSLAPSDNPTSSGLVPTSITSTTSITTTPSTTPITKPGSLNASGSMTTNSLTSTKFSTISSTLSSTLFSTQSLTSSSSSSTSTTSAGADTSGGGGLDVGNIVGIVFGAVGALGALAGIIFGLRQWNRRVPEDRLVGDF